MNFFKEIFRVLMNEFTLAKMVVYITAFIAPLIPFVAAAILLTIVDTGLGIWAAKVQKKKIKSRTFANGILPKLILYPLSIVVGGLFEYLLPEIPAIRMAVGVLALIEGSSIYEKISTILGVDLFKYLKMYLKRQEIFANSEEDDN